MDKQIINLGWKLLLITLVAGLILGLVYTITKDPIAEQELRAAQEARQAVLNADEFEEIDLEALKGRAEYESGFDNITGAFIGYLGGEPCGMTIQISQKGYGGQIVMTFGIDAQGTVTNMVVNSHSETPGLGAKIEEEDFRKQFTGKLAAEAISAVSHPSGNEIQAISGASVSSKAAASAASVCGAFFTAFYQEEAQE